MNFWVVRVNGRDILSGGFYRNATRVAGPYSSKADATPKQREFNSELTDYDRAIERIGYVIWSDDDVENMRRIGTRI
jgi:hypothetical protein